MTANGSTALSGAQGQQLPAWDRCPNFPPCGHSVLMHQVSDDASGYACAATDRAPDDRQQQYIEARCPCGRKDGAR